MPFIKKVKKGKFPAFEGSSAVEVIEVDEFGNPIIRDGGNRGLKEVSKGISRTEKKIAPGIRAPDVIKGYDKPFNYHLWNKLRAERKARKRKKK